MNGQIEWNYEDGQLKDYAAEILTLGLCRLFLQEQFVSGKGYMTGSCRTEGYRALASLERLRTEEILSIVIALLQGAYEAEKHYLFSEDYQISQNILFVDPKFSELKLLFIPDAEGLSLREKIKELLKTLGEKGSAEGKGYIERAVFFMEHEASGYQSALHHFEILRREVYLCGVE